MDDEFGIYNRNPRSSQLDIHFDYDARTQAVIKRSIFRLSNNKVVSS